MGHWKYCLAKWYLNRDYPQAERCNKSHFLPSRPIKPPSRRLQGTRRLFTVSRYNVRHSSALTTTLCCSGLSLWLDFYKILLSTLKNSNFSLFFTKISTVMRRNIHKNFDIQNLILDILDNNINLKTSYAKTLQFSSLTFLRT